VGFLAGQWEYYLKLYFGTGVSPCYRGHRLYDPLHPAGAALVKKYTDWNMQYRVILHADIIHLKRADGSGIDAILHVEPNTAKCKERAMLVVFNQNANAAVNTTLRVPLYYSGDSIAACHSVPTAQPQPCWQACLLACIDFAVLRLPVWSSSRIKRVGRHQLVTG